MCANVTQIPVKTTHQNTFNSTHTKTRESPLDPNRIPLNKINKYTYYTHLKSIRFSCKRNIAYFNIHPINTTRLIQIRSQLHIHSIPHVHCPTNQRTCFVRLSTCSTVVSTWLKITSASRRFRRRFCNMPSKLSRPERVVSEPTTCFRSSASSDSSAILAAMRVRSLVLSSRPAALRWRPPFGQILLLQQSGWMETFTCYSITPSSKAHSHSQYGTHDGFDALGRYGRLCRLYDLLVGRMTDPGGAQQPVDDAAAKPLGARLQIEHLVEQVQGGRQRRIVPGVLRDNEYIHRFEYIFIYTNTICIL